MGDGGKGSGRRPQLAPEEETDKRWKEIFKEKEKPCGCKPWSLSCTHDKEKKKNE
jgi:hypothetical protein